MSFRKNLFFFKLHKLFALFSEWRDIKSTNDFINFSLKFLFHIDVINTPYIFNISAYLNSKYIPKFRSFFSLNYNQYMLCIYDKPKNYMRRHIVFSFRILAFLNIRLFMKLLMFFAYMHKMNNFINKRMFRENWMLKIHFNYAKAEYSRSDCWK